MKNTLIGKFIKLYEMFQFGRLLSFKSSFGIASIIVFALLSSCEYKLKSENFNDINKPDTTQKIYLLLSPKDTFYLFTVPTEIHYNLNTFGLKIYNVEVFIDGSSIYKGDQEESSFTLYPAYIERGYRTMSLVVTTNTNTLSLADLTGYEGLVFKKEWHIYVDGSGPEALKITHIFNDNGLLKLEWDPYVRPNFQSYRIWSINVPVNNSFDGYLVAEITDPHQNWWYDSSYVGGTSTYWVEIKASNQYASSEKVQYIYSFPKLQTLWQRGDSALFEWNKHAFYRALDSYSITTTSSIYPYNQVTVFSSTSPNDTTFLMRKMRFGHTIDYTLNHRAKKSIIPRLGINVVTDGIFRAVGNIFPKTSYIKELVDKPVLYLRGGDKITKINFPAGDTILQFIYGNFIYGTWGIMADDRYIFTWGGNTMVTHDNQTFSQLNTATYAWPGLPSNPDVSMKGTSIGRFDDGLGLYDFVNGRYIFTGKNKGLYGATISPDGKFAFSSQFETNSNAMIVSQVTDTGLVEKWRITDTSFGAVKWLQEDYSKLLVKEQNTVKIYNPADKSVLYTINVKAAAFGGIDPVSGKLFVWDYVPGQDDKNKAYLYDYRSGNFKYELNLAPRFDFLTIYRSYLISGDGYSLDISNF
jgi:hypothetical protein